MTDGETGFLTKGETGEMADAAIGLLLDAERRTAMGQAARRLVEARFSRPRQIDAMVAHYEALHRGAALMAGSTARTQRCGWASRPTGTRTPPGPGHQGLLSWDPARPHAAARAGVLPEVRYILPDRISLDASADPRTLETMARFLERQSWLVRRVAVT